MRSSFSSPLALPVSVANGGTGRTALPFTLLKGGGANFQFATGGFAWELITGMIVDVDAGSAWASNAYTVPVTGRYIVTFSCPKDTACAVHLVLFKGGVLFRYLGGNTSDSNLHGSAVVNVVAGDVLDFRSQSLASGGFIYTAVPEAQASFTLLVN